MRKFRILMVEDNPGDVFLAREALCESKFIIDLEVVKDGKAGIDYLLGKSEFIGKPKPDLILLDINLPLKSGHQVLREIKANPLTRSIPVIMLTTSSTQEDILSSYQQQASFYLVKPNEMGQFDEFVKMFERFCSTL